MWTLPSQNVFSTLYWNIAFIKKSTHKFTCTCIRSIQFCEILNTGLRGKNHITTTLKLLLGSLLYLFHKYNYHHYFHTVPYFSFIQIELCIGYSFCGWLLLFNLVSWDCPFCCVQLWFIHSNCCLIFHCRNSELILKLACCRDRLVTDIGLNAKTSDSNDTVYWER